MRYSPLLAGKSATSLPLYCSESLTSRDLFAGFTPDISDWEAQGVPKPMGAGLESSKAAKPPIARNSL